MCRQLGALLTFIAIAGCDRQDPVDCLDTPEHVFCERTCRENSDFDWCPCIAERTEEACRSVCAEAGYNNTVCRSFEPMDAGE